MHLLRSASDPLVDSDVLPFRCSEANKFHGLNDFDGSFVSSYDATSMINPFILFWGLFSHGIRRSGTATKPT